MNRIKNIYRHAGHFFVLPQDHVNSFIVETENSVVIVDATLASSSGLAMRKRADEIGKDCSVVLLTHGHPDHWGGLVHFKDKTIYSSQGAYDFAREEDIIKSPTAKGALGDDWPDERVFPNNIIPDGFSIDVDGLKFKFSDLGPGESPSDGMWTVEDDGIKHVFLGDSISDGCHQFFRDLNLFEWLKMQDRFIKEFDQNTRFYVGHGMPGITVDSIAWQKGYLNAFLKSLQSIKGTTVTKEVEDKVLNDMKRYLPINATEFLLTYELDITIKKMLEKL